MAKKKLKITSSPTGIEHAQADDQLPLVKNQIEENPTEFPLSFNQFKSFLDRTRVATNTYLEKIASEYIDDIPKLITMI